MKLSQKSEIFPYSWPNKVPPLARPLAAWRRPCVAGRRACAAARGPRAAARLWWRAAAPPLLASAGRVKRKRESGWVEREIFEREERLGFRWGEEGWFTEKRKSFSDLNVRVVSFAKRPLIIPFFNKLILPLWCHLAKIQDQLILTLQLNSPCSPNTPTN